MARFNVGQIVELDAWGFGEGAELQTGDRGTVIVAGRMREFDSVVANVRWHKTVRASEMVEYRQKVYTQPPAHFSVGQIVELDMTGFDQDETFQTGEAT